MTVKWNHLVACHGNSVCLLFTQVELSRELLWITKISSFARGVKKLQCLLKESHFSCILSVSSRLQCLATDSLALWLNTDSRNSCCASFHWSRKDEVGVSTYWVIKSAQRSEAAAVSCAKCCLCMQAKTHDGGLPVANISYFLAAAGTVCVQRRWLPNIA